jgi:hypothetical protein
MKSRPASSLPRPHWADPCQSFIASNREANEPPHIHVRSSDGAAEFWLSPVHLRDAWGYTPREIERIRRMVIGNRDQLLRRWHEFFA